jgi:hypothetical protein
VNHAAADALTRIETQLQARRKHGYRSEIFSYALVAQPARQLQAGQLQAGQFQARQLQARQMHARQSLTYLAWLFWLGTRTIRDR